MSELRADCILLGTNWSGVSAQVHGEPKDLDKKAALALDSAPMKCLEVLRAAGGRRGSGEAARRKI